MTARLWTSPAAHKYKLDGAEVPSVTTVLNAIPKQLTQWAANAAADYAIEHWAELGEQPLSKRLDAIRYAHRDVVKAAALRGTKIHTYGEALVAGQAVEDPEYLGPAQAYARFLDQWRIEPIAVETPVVNVTHRYAGRPDLWCTIGARDNATALVDLKTGKNVYAEVALQLAAYRWAELWQPDGPATEGPVAPVDLVYVAHIGPDDVAMIPVDLGPADPAGNPHFRQFLYVLQTHHWLKAHGYKAPEPLLGEAQRP